MLSGSNISVWRGAHSAKTMAHPSRAATTALLAGRTQPSNTWRSKHVQRRPSLPDAGGADVDTAALQHRQVGSHHPTIARAERRLSPATIEPAGRSEHCTGTVVGEDARNARRQRRAGQRPPRGGANHPSIIIAVAVIARIMPSNGKSRRCAVNHGAGRGAGLSCMDFPD